VAASSSTILASASLVLLLLASGSKAQDAPEVAKRLKAEYENCVYDAVGAQWKGNPRLDSNAGTETAFLACQTEQQAIETLLYSIHTPPVQVVAAILGIKVALKRTVRAIMADPKKYLLEHGG
jgi:hypothetical protein